MPSTPPSPPPSPPVSRSPSRAWPVLVTAGGALAVAIAALAATGGSPILFMGELASNGWPVLLWFGAAWGYGLPLAAMTRGPDDRRDAAARIALGVAALLVLDSMVLRLHAGAEAAWAVTAVGILIAGIDAWRMRGAGLAGLGSPDGRATPIPMAALMAVPIGILLAAASTAPGWLWASEFGGYDALSYHLQLPAEWAEAGRSRPLDHSVYSFLPNAVEHGFLHVGLLRGDIRLAGVTAQFLHAGLAIGAAFATGGVARILRERAGGSPAAARGAGVFAAVLVLATPWSIVTGSLAYTEMAVLWMLAASMRSTLERDGATSIGEGIEHGVLAGAATAAKLTAAPLAVLPAVIWWLTLRRRPAGSSPWGPSWLVPIAVGGGLAGAVALVPWLAANTAHAGNPLFPFATDLLGAGHWTAEQVEAWRLGHGGGGGLRDVAREWLAHGVSGDEPAQWGVLPIAGLAAIGLGAAVAGPNRRTAAGLGGMIIIAVLAWATVTHAESRFLLPTAVPLAIAIAVAPGGRPRWARVGSGAGVILAATQVVWIVAIAAREQDGRAGLGLGATPAFRGDAHEAALADARRRRNVVDVRELRAIAPPAWWIRYGIEPGSRVLMIGEAAVFHHPGDRLAYRTVWDRDALSRWLDKRDTGRSAIGWAGHARAAGFTHAFVDRIMLENWAERGWNDPRMRWATLVERAGVDLTPVASFDDGGRLLVRLGEAID